VSFADLGKFTARLKPGSSVAATVIRSGARLSVPLTVGQLPDPPATPARPGDDALWVRELALGVARTTPEIRKAIKAEEEGGGLIVTQLRAGGAAALAGLRIGDLITNAGAQRLDDTRDLATAPAPSVRLPLLLRIVRDGSPRFVAVTGTDER
jgi:S1-C subfamily serine protease